MNPQSVLVTVEGITVEASDDGIAPNDENDASKGNGILITGF